MWGGVLGRVVCVLGRVGCVLGRVGCVLGRVRAGVGECGVCVGVCRVVGGCLGSLGKESIARSALLSGYLGKSGHLPRFLKEKKIGEHFLQTSFDDIHFIMHSSTLLWSRVK